MPYLFEHPIIRNSQSFIAFSKSLTDNPSLRENLRSFSAGPDLFRNQEKLRRYMLSILRCAPNLTHLWAFPGEVSAWNAQDDYPEHRYIRTGWEAFRTLAVTAGPRLLTITRMAMDDSPSCKSFRTRSPAVFSHFSSLLRLHGRINIRFTVNKTNISPDWLPNLVYLELSDAHPSCFEVLTRMK